MPANIKTIELRNLQIEDYKELKKSMVESYPEMADSFWKEDQIEVLLKKFPEGQLVIVVDGIVVGSAMSLLVTEDFAFKTRTYKAITGNFTFSTHNPNGEVLYGIDVFINPQYRGLRLGRRLYDVRKELCEQLNLKSIIFAGRIPNYAKFKDEITPKVYIEKVKKKEIYDPVLSFQLSNDFHELRVLKNYLLGDTESLEFAVLLEWNNIYYDDSPKLINTTKSVVRLGLIQWQMRSLGNLDALFEQAEFFIDAVSGYGSDFALFQEFAISYNINIITGSMPFIENEHVYNVGFLCKRDGTNEMYRKIHITPNEVFHWGITGGDTIQTFDTDCGKIGIVICYDVEFPELSRLMADEGMNILFVPFLTDTQNGYTRVRHCAQARAIENECYVAIAGCVGNLPKVNNMDIQYAQAAVFTPSDFAFPSNGIKAEATPNTEMTLIVDVDMNLLKELHEHGSVNTMKDRRHDLYNLTRLK